MDQLFEETIINDHERFGPKNDRAEWQLGAVSLLANESVPHSLSSKYDRAAGSELQSETWFLVRGGREIQHSCHGNESLIIFNGANCKSITPRYIIILLS